MTQSFFVFLTSIAMLFAPIFGLAHPVEKPVPLPDEAQPEYSEYAHFDRIDGVSDSVFYIKRHDSKIFMKTVRADFFSRVQTDCAKTIYFIKQWATR